VSKYASAGRNSSTYCREVSVRIETRDASPSSSDSTNAAKGKLHACIDKTGAANALAKPALAASTGSAAASPTRLHRPAAALPSMGAGPVGTGPAVRSPSMAAALVLITAGVASVLVRSA